jgi:NAD(P)-dependent dehydrogenase (short-subunit alcohol dehydrogenase family)
MKVWLITGAARGLGRVLAEHVLAKGDAVAATARNLSALDDLVALAPDRVLPVLLDVNVSEACAPAVAQVLARFGRVDVLVNNAGYGLAGAVEEVSMAQARQQMETNFFGAVAMSQAVLPAMRAQKRGHLLQISSIAGLVGTPGLGIYNASKFALEGMSEALAYEVAHLGIKVTIIEPGPFRTDWAGGSMDWADPIADYAASAGKTRDYLANVSHNQAGDPQKAAEAMITVVEADKPPLRLGLGAIFYDRARAKVKRFVAELEQWEAVGLPTDFTD